MDIKIKPQIGVRSIRTIRRTNQLCNFAITGGNMNGYYGFKRRFQVLSDISTIFQEKIDRTLKNETPVWLDDIIIVTRWDKMNTEKNCSKYWKNSKKPGTGQPKSFSEFFP